MSLHVFIISLIIFSSWHFLITSPVLTPKMWIKHLWIPKRCYWDEGDTPSLPISQLIFFFSLEWSNQILHHVPWAIRRQLSSSFYLTETHQSMAATWQMYSLHNWWQFGILQWQPLLFKLIFHPNSPRHTACAHLAVLNLKNMCLRTSSIYFTLINCSRWILCFRVLHWNKKNGKSSLIGW